MTLPFIEPDFADLWAEWLAYRKEKRLPLYRPIGLKKTFTRLVRESGGDVTAAMDMINYSMEQNYQGIFKRKDGNQSSNSGSKGNDRIEALRRW